MPTSTTFEVAIGVIFVYLVLSLICTAANEGISTFLNQRGRNLFEGVKNLLNDPTFTGLAQQLYNHGLVDGLSQEASNSQRPNRHPSYMPASTFSLALLDILGSRGIVDAAHGELLTRAEAADDAYEAARGATDSRLAAKKDAAERARNALVAAADAARKHYDTANAAAGDPEAAAVAQAKSELERASAAVKMLDARRAAVESARNPLDAETRRKASDTLEVALAAGRMVATQIPDKLASIQAAVNRLPQGHTKESLLVLIDKSKREVEGIQSQLERFRGNIESWFDDAMDRVGGWYKRWTQKILLALAALFVVILNADTIVLIQRFSTDAELRATVLAAAEKASAEGGDAANLQMKISSLSAPLGWSTDVNDSRAFPWVAVRADETSWWGKVVWRSLEKLMGLIISIGAVSLGAPFWFDMLNKIVNLRGAGTPPGESKKSAPQPRTA